MRFSALWCLAAAVELKRSSLRVAAEAAIESDPDLSGGSRAPEGQQRIAISVVAKRNTTSASVPDLARVPRTDWGQFVGEEDTNISNARVPRTNWGEENWRATDMKIRAYLMQSRQRCKSEGIGRMVTCTKAMFDVAVSEGLRVVCMPRDWRTEEHATGNVGFLFGCTSETEAEGQFVSLKDVRGDASLIFENVTLNYAPTAVDESPNDVHDKTLHSLNTTARDNHVYDVVGPTGDDRWGKSWRFYRSQYHLVRQKNPNRTQALRGFNIVILVRRGDLRARSHGSFGGGGSGGYTPRTYVDCVETLQNIRGVMDHVQSEISINVIAEESNETADAKQLKGNFTALQRKYGTKINQTRFFFGDREKDTYNTTGQGQFIRDLDIISLADVLILSPGYFSSLGAALQMNGIAFSIQKFGHRHDLPNHIVPEHSKDYSWANVSEYANYSWTNGSEYVNYSWTNGSLGGGINHPWASDSGNDHYANYSWAKGPDYAQYSWANGSGYVNWPVSIFGAAELAPFRLP